MGLLPVRTHPPFLARYLTASNESVHAQNAIRSKDKSALWHWVLHFTFAETNYVPQGCLLESAPHLWQVQVCWQNLLRSDLFLV